MSKREQIRDRRRKQRQRQFLITGLAITGIVLILVAIIIWQNTGPLGDVIIPEPINHPLADGTRMGDPSAPVVIEEYSDYLCSFCKRHVDETEPSLIQDYIETGLVYFIYHTFPLSADSYSPSEASLCAADQGKFWEYHDLLFANQLGHDPSAYSSRRLRAYAEAVPLDLDTFNACISQGKYSTQVEQSRIEGQNLGVSSTPTFFINGKMIEGAQPFGVFQNEIEAALAAVGGS
jgi:protein-disulfide isomerase